MTQLPYFQSLEPSLNLLQTKYRSILNPVLAIPMLDGLQLTDVDLISGVTVIPHRLARKMQGWIITDQNASAVIYRSQPLNDKFLTLTSNAQVRVSLWVY